MNVRLESTSTRWHVLHVEQLEPEGTLGGRLIALKFTSVTGFIMTESNARRVQAKTAQGDYIRTGLRFLLGLTVLSFCT